MAEPLRVVIVEDSYLVREGTRQLLDEAYAYALFKEGTAGLGYLLKDRVRPTR